MKWRPTLAALAVLATVGALAVAMSSGSAPAASVSPAGPVGAPASGPPTVQPMAAAAQPEPTERPDSVTTVVEEDLAEAVPPAETAGEGGPPGGEDPSGGEGPAAADPAGADGAEDEARRRRLDDIRAADSLDAGNGTAASALPATASSGAVDPARAGTASTTCSDPSDPFFALYLAGENCYSPPVAEGLYAGPTGAEPALVESIPFVAGYVAEPLGRPARIIRRGPPGEAGAPRFYLTFDDGPSTRWTPPTLDLLDRHGARATFFPLGLNAEVNFHLIEEIVARGHTVGSHLWSHDRAALTSEELFRRELRASAELFGALGTNCLRTPFGVLSDDIAEWAGDEGFEILHWGEPDPRDWELPGTEALIRSMLDMQNGSILILHEHTGTDTLVALDAVLEILDAEGWRFDEPICPLQF